MSQPIFEIIDGDKHYKIYETGKVEGFRKDVVIINRIPVVFAERLAKIESAYPSSSEASA